MVAPALLFRITVHESGKKKEEGRERKKEGRKKMEISVNRSRHEITRQSDLSTHMITTDKFGRNVRCSFCAPMFA